MPGTRDHDPLVIEDFQGLWKRGDDESAPSDHFIRADNIQYFHSGFATRDGIIPYLNSALPLLKFVRIYNYVTQHGQTILGLVDGGDIYHVDKSSNQSPFLVLSIPAMEDFGFVAINGRAYITPFKSYINPQGERYQLGIINEFVYVYLGDFAPARKAGGLPPINGGGSFTVSNSVSGQTDIGLHLFGVVYETSSGFLTAPGPEVFPSLDLVGNLGLFFDSIPTSLTVNGQDYAVIRRHLVSTKAILNYSGDQKGYQFFFIPGGTINDTSTLSKSINQMFDADLIADASHLFDNFTQIPSGVNLNTYHSRLVIVGEFGLDATFGSDSTLDGLPAGVTDNRSIARVSFPGEPEAIDKVEGLIVTPLDGKALTNAQELRDVLFLFKNTRTYSYSDNLDVPSSWQEEVVDQAMGVSVHGIATVLDSGGSNIDFLLIADWSGLLIFNGTYAQPELTWKIEDIWRAFDRNLFNQIQIVNDSLNKHLWITSPSPNRIVVLHADYANGLNAKDIRWTRWVFNTTVTTIALIETDRLIIGSIGPDIVLINPLLELLDGYTG